MRRRGTRWAIWLAWSVLVAPAVAQAAPRDRPQTEADAHKKRAFELFAQQDYAGGIAALEKAHGLVPHPTFLFNIAAAYDQWPGHCAQAFVAFDRFFDACRGCEVAAVARKRHAALETRCLVSVTVESDPAGAKLFVDGRGVGVAPATLWLKPGERSLVAAHPDGRAITRTVVVVEGAAQVVRLGDEPRKAPPAPPVLAVTPPAAAEATPGPRALPAPDAALLAQPEVEASSEEGASSAWALLPAGAGAVAAGVGAVLGWQARSGLDASPVDPRFAETRADAESQATAANVSFAIAGGLAATAIVVWLALD